MVVTDNLNRPNPTLPVTPSTLTQHWRPVTMTDEERKPEDGRFVPVHGEVALVPAAMVIRRDLGETKEDYTLGLCAPACQMSSKGSTEDNAGTENCTMASIAAPKVSLNVQSSDDDFMKKRCSYIESNTKPFQKKYKAAKNEATCSKCFRKEMKIVDLIL